MEVVLPIAPDALLEVTKDWFVTELGFALLSIVPADAPREAVLQGHGLRLRLRKLESAAPPGAAAAVLRLTTAAAGVGGAPRTLTAPNGSVVEVVAKLEPPLPLPPLQEALFICREREENAGRAGMLYRDLIPNRLGGRFIASHIRIPDAGPVPDVRGAAPAAAPAAPRVAAALLLLPLVPLLPAAHRADVSTASSSRRCCTSTSAASS